MTAPDATGINVTMQEILRRSFAQADDFHAAAREFRNRLVLILLIIVLAAGALVGVQACWTSAPIFRRPDDADHLARWAVMLLLMLFGVVGALITAIPAMSAVPKVKSPYNFPLQQGLVKCALGALTALVGVIAVANPTVTSGFPSLEALMGVATVFGAGQQTVTRFLDKRAQKILADTPE